MAGMTWPAVLVGAQLAADELEARSLIQQGAVLVTDELYREITGGRCVEQPLTARHIGAQPFPGEYTVHVNGRSAAVVVESRKVAA